MRFLLYLTPIILYPIKMKKAIRNCLAGLLVMTSGFVFAQDTVTMVFSHELLKDAYINIVNDEPDAARQSLISSVWTYYGEFGIGRSLIGFDFSALRNDYKVLDATLNLYHNPISGHIGHSAIGGDNTGMIFRITEHWEDITVTWANQPATTNTNAIVIPAPENDSADFINVDILPIIRDMIRHPENSDGFMIKLFSEEAQYRSLVFASSDHPDLNLHPSIVITFVTELPADSMSALQPDGESGEDAFITSDGVGKTNSQSLIASVSDSDQGLSLSRSFLNFDLSEYSDPSAITLAELSLFHDPYAFIEGHVNGGKSNAVLISRITESWNEEEIDWNNQPAVSAENSVVLPSSNIENQDYLDIDVTEMVKDMLLNKEESHGFMLSLNDEQTTGYDRNVVFASSNHDVQQLRPKLVIYTKGTVGITSKPNNELVVKVSPNPGNGLFSVQIPEGESVASYRVFDVTGNLVEEGKSLNGNFEINLTDKPTGLYFLTTSINGGMVTNKMLKR